MGEGVRKLSRAALAALALAVGISLAASRPAFATTASGTIITNLAETFWWYDWWIIPTDPAVTSTAYVQVQGVPLSFRVDKVQIPASPGIGEPVTY